MRPALCRLAVAAAVTVTLVAPVVLGGRANASARPLRDSAGPYHLEVLVDGQPARTFDHGAETWLLGQLGARYTLRVVNRSARRVEAVVTVDGRDVIDGRPGDFRNKRGYLVPAWGSVDIDGWRVSQRQAAAFRFSSVSDSYAARTGGGREVGVIGVAIFPERFVPPPRPVYVPRRPTTTPSPWYGDRDQELGLGSDPGRPRDRAAGPPPASAPSGAGKAEAAADAASGTVAREKSRHERPGLGTEYGESVSSEVREVEFVRANVTSPSVILGARYNDHDGLVAIGIPVDEPHYDSDGDLRESAEPFPTADRRYAAPPPGWRR